MRDVHTITTNAIAYLAVLEISSRACEILRLPTTARFLRFPFLRLLRVSTVQSATKLIEVVMECFARAPHALDEGDELNELILPETSPLIPLLFLTFIRTGLSIT